MTRFFVEFVFVSENRKTLLVNLSVLCFRKFSVAKKFIDKRGGDYQDFASKIFCLTVPENLVGYPFRVSLISGIEKFYASEGYVMIFCRNFFSQSAEKLVDEPFSVSLISGIEIVYASDGYVTIFRRSLFLSRNTEKPCKGNLLCCVSESFWYRTSLWIKTGEEQDFPSKISCLTVSIHFVEELLSAVSENFW